MPFYISCEEVEDFIMAYLEEDMPVVTRIKFEMHIKMCKECRDYLASYNQTIALSRAAVKAEDLPPLPEDLVKAIMDAKDLPTEKL